MISGSNEQLQQQLEYTLLKSNCHSWSISKMQSGREDTLEERYAIKFCFKHGKNGRPAFARPYEGMHRSMSLKSSSLLLQQCLACLVCLTWIAFVMDGRWPYSCLFNIARSMLGPVVL